MKIRGVILSPHPPPAAHRVMSNRANHASRIITLCALAALPLICHTTNKMRRSQVIGRGAVSMDNISHSNGHSPDPTAHADTTVKQDTVRARKRGLDSLKL